MVNIDPLRKKPFVRFLLWVYMTTGGDKIQTGSTILHHDEYVYYLSKNVVFNICLCGLLDKCGAFWNKHVYYWMNLLKR